MRKWTKTGNPEIRTASETVDFGSFAAASAFVRTASQGRNGNAEAGVLEGVGIAV